MKKKSGMPPLSLLTIAAMFPDDTELSLVDMNVEPLTPDHLAWADAAFFTAMGVQKTSLQQVLKRAKAAGKKTVLGGPYATSYFDLLMIREEWPVDHYVVGEAEGIFPDFFRTFRGGCAAKVWQATNFPDIITSPVPRFDLVNLANYAYIPVQYSRGCPFQCEFCDIIKLNGRVPRTKDPHQLLRELDYLLACGWKGPVFLVDDNFIGNQRSVGEFLLHLSKWQKEHGFPFLFSTEASINLAKLPRLMELMREAGFYMVFVGIETPSPAALERTKKFQNLNRHSASKFLLESVRTIQTHFEVMGGFIAGLDGEGPESFAAITEFAQQAGIPQAMSGLLTAYRNTDLYDRLKAEGRLRGESDGDNVGRSLNFDPELDEGTLLRGYRSILDRLYGQNLRPYYERCLTLMRNSPPPRSRRKGSTFRVLADIGAFLRSARALYGREYFRFLLQVLREFPRRFPYAARLAALGYHFQKVASGVVADLDARLQELSKNNHGR
ncbi:MAG: B12-binding domain-containing radical SAM protein [Candidatus Doudnabacteria bacterium]|nr:B12-binding domain-containing radical SAM protein [Candidatus Doudnabacteria bacterium]